MEALKLTPEKLPVTASGDVGVVMLAPCREGTDDDGVKYRYFECITAFLKPPMRIEWNCDTMEAVLPAGAAGFLIKNRYARAMTDHEVRAYNKGLEKPTEAPSKKTEKGATS